MPDPAQHVRADKEAVTRAWARTLAQIPSLYGRLVHLSSLRNPNTLRYEHHGLSAIFGPHAAQAALAKSHLETFNEWLKCSLEQQRTDLKFYLSTLDEPRDRILDSWIRLGTFRTLPPVTITEAQREHFIMTVETLIPLLRVESGAA